MIEMRDGVNLATDVWFPDSLPEPLPVLLIRTPYDKDYAFDESFAYLYAELYRIIVVAQDTRGQHSSEGMDSIFATDGWSRLQDGYDTFEWIISQNWCNGRIGMRGSSASGIVQYLVSGARKNNFICASPSVAGCNLYQNLIFPGGCWNKNLMESWMQEQKTSYMINCYENQTRYNDYWKLLNIEEKRTFINVPMLHIGGWFDLFTNGAVQGFSDLQNYGDILAKGNQKLLIGPWTHCGINERKQGELTYPANSTYSIQEYQSQWFLHYLNGEENNVEKKANVIFYLMGDVYSQNSYSNIWVESSVWPLSDSKYKKFYLSSEGKLSEDLPTNDGYREYYYDPDDPVPTKGGRNLYIPAGPYDQRSIEQRNDVLTFETYPLTTPLIITGKIIAHLFASSSCIDTDWAVKICDVYQNGKSMLVEEGILKARYKEGFDKESFMEPGQIYEFLIDLGEIAQCFDIDHKIRIDITSSNYPHFEVNPNTGEPWRNETRKMIAQNRIYCSPQYASYIDMPMIYDEKGFKSKITRIPYKINASVFPNPARNLINIVIHGELNGLKGKIYDLNGRFIFELGTPEKKGKGWYSWKINCSKFQPGLHYIKVCSDNKLTVVKSVLIIH
ncbi:MAG: CocE/NonD family hydrolase [Candidatus Coatesbacteria bacterium]|nr:CocE/NonD family hydrolase [Candidatus Coatesbacteria bacterium]